MTEPFAIMGIVNVTPDSFSDGGLLEDAVAAVDHGLALASQGADIVDVGGESTRPGAEPVDAQAEVVRVVPVVEGLVRRGCSAVVSVDTSKRTVAEAALDAGARYVNDVTALRGDPEMAGLIADRRVRCCLMHMRGEPRTMQVEPRYDDVVDDVRWFLEDRLEWALREGIREEMIDLDPGIGFGKTLEHNLELLRRLHAIAGLGRPVVVGVSRKQFIGRLTGREVGERVPGTIAANVLALERGASVFRVHDVAANRDALRVAAATLARYG